MNGNQIALFFHRPGTRSYIHHEKKTYIISWSWWPSTWGTSGCSLSFKYTCLTEERQNTTKILQFTTHRYLMLVLLEITISLTAHKPSAITSTGDRISTQSFDFKREHMSLKTSKEIREYFMFCQQYKRISQNTGRQQMARRPIIYCSRPGHEKLLYYFTAEVLSNVCTTVTWYYTGPRYDTGSHFYETESFRDSSHFQVHFGLHVIYGDTDGNLTLSNLIRISNFICFLMFCVQITLN
jgi:hypothetical protein